MPSLTIENYVKTIYQICARQGGEPATTGEIATGLQVSPGTVTSMLKTLSESELATYAPYEGVRLTDAGKALASMTAQPRPGMWPTSITTAPG